VGSEKGVESPELSIVPFTWALSQAIDRLPTVVYCDVVTPLIA
jgi:hypothetical protein